MSERFSDAVSYTKNIQNLDFEIQKLKYTRNIVQRSIDEAKRNGEEIVVSVTDWLNESQKTVQEAEEIVSTAGRVPFFNIKRRYFLSRKAREKSLSIAHLRDVTIGQGFYTRPILQPVEPTSDNDELTCPSRILILNHIIYSLKDPNINMIGIYGMAGSGKTTLAKNVRRRAERDKLFDVVAMAIVSPTPDSIQDQIAESLNLQFETRNPAGRATSLRARIMEFKKILVVLDDIFAKHDLEIIGIPHGSDHVGCKLLFTSRSAHVLYIMGTQRDFKLEALTNDEAWSLFENSVGGSLDSELRPIGMEIARRCDGLPLLILNVARYLKGQNSCEWRHALDQLCNFDSDSATQPHTALQWSFDQLEVEQKAIFLLCGLLGEMNLRILDLLKFSVGLDLFESKMPLEAAGMKLLHLIQVLKDSCLLLDNDMNGFIQMNDEVSDFAFTLANQDRTFTVCRRGDVLNDWPDSNTLKDCNKIYLPRCDIHELPERLECPELEFFLLSNKNHSLRIPGPFFEQIQKLKGLYLSGMSFLSLPPSLGSLEKLRALCLHYCMLGDISRVGVLENLEILSFQNSDIVELPKEISGLHRLKLLDLSHCSKLKVISANVISGLSKLEQLYMIDSFVLWEVQDLNNGNNASLAELEELSRLTTLEVQVLDAKMVPEKWILEKLESYRILIGDLINRDGKEEISKQLELKLNTEVHAAHGINMLLKELEVLCFDGVKRIKTLFSDLHAQGFPKLEYLEVKNCSELEYVVDSANIVSWTAFPRLQSVSLENLSNLEKIFHEQLSADSFSNLKTIKVRTCSRLKNLLSFSVIRHLVKLEEMEVADCESMESVVVHKCVDGVTKGIEEANDQLTLLKSVTLCQLPHLRSFSSESKVDESKQLATEHHAIPSPLFCSLDFCPNVETLRVSAIACGELFPSVSSSFASFQNLVHLEVSNCNRLMRLLSSSLAKTMERLVSIRVQNCDGLKEIVAEPQDEETKTITFTRLRTLALVGLQNITCFCLGHLNFEFPSLEEVIVAKCPRLEIFSTGISTTPLLKNVIIEFPSTEKSRWAGNLDDTISQMNMETEVTAEEKKFESTF